MKTKILTLALSALSLSYINPVQAADASAKAKTEKHSTDLVPAQEVKSADVWTPNLQQGRWNLSGGFSVNKNKNIRHNSTEFTVSAGAEHFFFDHFSAGVETAIYVESRESTVATLGPTAHYHFLVSDPVSLSVGGSYDFGLNNASVDSIVYGEFGVNYFLTPSVAFGPKFYYARYNYSVGDATRFGASFNFGIFL